MSGLKGDGEPLPDRPGDRILDPGDAVGHRIMAEAGALPEEVLLKLQVDEARKTLANAPTAARKQAMARVAEMELKLAIAQEARRKFLK